MAYKDINQILKNNDNNRYIQHTTSVEAIKNSLRNILLVSRGTLPGDPDFGSDLSRILFNPLDGLTKNIQESFIREAVYRYEPRVRIQNIELFQAPEHHRVDVSIEFEFINKHTGEVLVDNVKIPFSLI